MVNALLMNTQFAVARMPHFFRFKYFSSKLIKPRIQIDFENQNYQVKTINSATELAEVMRLRFEVFFKEFSQLPALFSFFTYDIDLHDFLCDHLIVKDKTSGRIIACYRLLASGTDARFYSEGEFDLTDFLRAPGNKLELGRACVHKEFRTGPVISLLWKGLIEYARRSDSKYLFGCSSIPRKDFSSYRPIQADLRRRGAVITEFGSRVQAEFLPPSGLDLGAACDDPGRDAARPLTSLMNMYLLAGAKFSQEAAYDKEMDCLDLLTILDIGQLPASFKRKFG
ncbi:MAG TPA: GNAT family N-acyltransferase [Bacteriovoracaceae bacterium]|nr:GNAT family N-acyltransferase [Bacteriovoracaceae bacterium]